MRSLIWSLLWQMPSLAKYTWSDPSSITDIAEYQLDTQRSLELYYSDFNPQYDTIFAGDTLLEVANALDGRLSETEMRSGLVLMARIEAAFRTDYLNRCEKKRPDDISIQFRKIFRDKGRYAGLETDIWNVWRNTHPSAKKIIGDLKGVFKFRHWIAHGRYWKPGNTYDFQTIYLLADTVFSSFDLYE